MTNRFFIYNFSFLILSCKSLPFLFNVGFINIRDIDPGVAAQKYFYSFFPEIRVVHGSDFSYLAKNLFHTTGFVIDVNGGPPRNCVGCPENVTFVVSDGLGEIVFFTIKMNGACVPIIALAENSTALFFILGQLIERFARQISHFLPAGHVGINLRNRVYFAVFPPHERRQNLPETVVRVFLEFFKCENRNYKG